MRINKITLRGLFIGLGVFALAGVVWAQDLTLTRIGVLSTVGVDYSIVNYSGSIPTFEGTASPSAQVLIRIKTSTDATVAASPSGIWKFTPGVLDAGSSTVEISSGLQSLSFALVFNATPSATPTATPTPIPDELPASGVWEYYLPAIGMGVVVLISGKKLKDKMMAWEGKKK